ncbi:helix-turn-helix domain-containing protein [Vagococcus jeotgali]|uniref:helix-turn-helix domain-containing protein n=1 Tax=Vagococcus jeotgali TaxID=3109030 RepID=UPI002DD817E8|nr:helix-turn-helix domain-containing protein [Vagococcus sp. B2T-5]
MNIAETVKKYRNEKKLTQEQLAKELNVSRSAVSSWEVGRNYPDLEMLVSISDLFGISLDELLREDNQVLEKITEDTQIRKKQTKKIKWLMIGIICLILMILFISFQSPNNQFISKSDQIESIGVTKDHKLLVTTELPFYKSITSYATNEKVDNPNIVELRIGTKIDLSFKNNESVEISPFSYPEMTDIHFVNGYGDMFKTYKVNP